MSYFRSEYVSNSDLKELRHRVDPKFEDPANLQDIFDFGNLVENVIFQPHLVDWNHKDIELAKNMATTFRADNICRQLLLVDDFRRQHEWYRSSRFGVKARCKMDGDSKKLGMIVEFKGLSIDNEDAFENAISRFDYDQGLAWYMDVSGYHRALIVAVSKKRPGRIFKRIVDRNHEYYARGVKKVHSAIRLWKQFFG